MISFLLFAGLVILFFWLASVSNRLSVLEKKFKHGNLDFVPAAKAEPMQTTPNNFLQRRTSQSMPEHLVAMPEPPRQVVKNEAEETEVAVNWLNRIGVVALVLGVGFFLKIAIDLGWIGPWAQIIIGLGIGGLLIYLAEIWKNRFGEKALALSGGGLAILYFSIYAAFNFYHLVPNLVAFIFMVAVAGFGVWLSYRNSSLVLGLLSFFGAYGAPLLYNSGAAHQIMILSYLTVINLAAVLVMFKKYWNYLLILTILGTIIDFTIWGAMYSNYGNTLNSVVFIIITAVIYAVGGSALIVLHQKKNSLTTNFENYAGLLGVLAGAFYFIASYSLLFNKYHNILPAIALLGAVIFFFGYALVDRLNFRNINYCLSFFGALLLVFAAVWQYDGRPLSAALLLLGFLGSTVGVLVKREELRVWGIIIVFIGLFKSLFDPYGASDVNFIFNAKFGLMFANTLVLLFIGWMYSKIEATNFEKDLEKGLQIVAALVLWISLSWDIIFPAHGITSADNFMTLWWIIYPVALAFAAFFGKRSGLFKTALLILAAGFFKVLLLSYTTDYHFLYNVKFGLMALETAAILVFAELSAKQDKDRKFSDVLKVIASLLLWFAVSWDIVKYFENEVSKNSRNLYLSLWWIAYSAVLMGAGIMWRNSLFRKIAIALFFVTILKVFLFDLLSLDLGYLIVSFVALGVILISVSFVYRKHKDEIYKFLEDKNNTTN